MMEQEKLKRLVLVLALTVAVVMLVINSGLLAYIFD